MKVFTQELFFNTKNRQEFINITDQVQQALARSGIKEGLCLVNPMHITASVFINDDESGLHKDFSAWLEKLAPFEKDKSPHQLQDDELGANNWCGDKYQHNLTGEDNADAHLKRTIMGREVVVAVTGGKFHFGPWEQIFYGEFDGQRKKRVLIKIIGE